MGGSLGNTLVVKFTKLSAYTAVPAESEQRERDHETCTYLKKALLSLDIIMRPLRMLLTISLWCVCFFILVCYNDKFGINIPSFVATGLMVSELERHKTNMNTKEKQILWYTLTLV